MKYILVRGASKAVPKIASDGGWLYGTRHDHKPYDRVHMLDVNWKAYKWADVCNKVACYQPTMALVPDFEHPSQLGQILQRIAQLQDLGVPEILICPKFEEAIPVMPMSVIIAISVPAPDYAGYIPPLWQIQNRRVHLLGGNPYNQADLIRKVSGAGGIIVSLDANGFVRESRRGKFWKHGRWVQLRDKKHNSTDLAIDSAINMRLYFETVLGEKQPQLL